jgi:predicted O-methyltransferase YrrM
MSFSDDASMMSLADTAVNQFGAVQQVTELAALLLLLRDHGVKNFLEIGSEAGGTFYAFCKIATGIKISLDDPSGNSGSKQYDSPEASTKRRQLFESFGGDVRTINGNSHNETVKNAVRMMLLGEPLDFLFIDGDHSTDGVRQDWEMYSPLVRPGGIVAFHDIKPGEYHEMRGCFVHEFWRTLQTKKSEILGSQNWWGGIGVVFV